MQTSKDQGDLHDTNCCNTVNSETVMFCGKYTDYLMELLYLLHHYGSDDII